MARIAPVLDRVEDVLDWLAAHVAAGVQLRTDSRQLQPGDVFVAWPGYAHDARTFVQGALDVGAGACLVEASGAEAFAWAEGAPVLRVRELKRMTGWLAHHWYGRPTEHLSVVATTGTNGKTSTAWWLAQALIEAGRPCAVIGTLGIGEPPSRRAPQGHVQYTGLTTPDPVTLQRTLAEWTGEPLQACAIEASSIGVVEHRLEGLHIDVALFTNFTPDHLDYHGSMEAYWDAKRALFGQPGLKAAVVNLDDPKGRDLVRDLEREGRLAAWGYSMRADADDARWRALDTHYDAGGGLGFTLQEGDASVEIRTGLIGEYNVANSLAVLGGLRVLGTPLEDLPRLATTFTPVPGRMQRVRVEGVGGPEVVVDYAHTPDALDKALGALEPLRLARGGELHCVFGCGGNRDATKRPVMGELAVRGSDQLVVTSDNPRHEDPLAIIDQIMAGVNAVPAEGRRARVCVDADRAEAIARTIAQAKDQDVVLIAGKGHEDYQDVAGVKHPFSDVEQAQAALQARRDQETR